MAGIFDRMKNWFNKKYEQYVVMPKVDKALKDLKEVIEGDNRIEKNKDKIKNSMNYLKQYPNILDEKKMSYLKDFVNGDIDEMMKDKQSKVVDNLKNVIGKSIDKNLASELIKTGDFTPLSKDVEYFMPPLHILNLKILHCGNKDEQERLISKAATNSKINIDKTWDLFEKYPYILMDDSSKDIEKTNASYSIIAQPKNFDLKSYQKEVMFVKECKETLGKISKGEELPEASLASLNERGKAIADYYNSLPQNPNDKNSRNVITLTETRIINTNLETIKKARESKGDHLPSPITPIKTQGNHLGRS